MNKTDHRPHVAAIGHDSLITQSSALGPTLHHTTTTTTPIRSKCNPKATDTMEARIGSIHRTYVEGESGYLCP